MKTLNDKDLEACVGGDSVEGCFEHKEGKILSGDQVKEAGVVVGGTLLQDGTISPDRFPWSPGEC